MFYLTCLCIGQKNIIFTIIPFIDIYTHMNANINKKKKDEREQNGVEIDN